MADKYVEQKLEEHSEELRGIRQELGVMNGTQIRMAASLEEHIRRTAQNEEAIAEEKKARAEADTKTDDRIKPLEKHVIITQAYIKLLLLLGGAPAFVYYVIKIIKEFS